MVVTHHAPHRGSVGPRYAHDQATPGFKSDLGTTIRRGRPALWVHGHIHHTCDYRVGDTRVLAKPKNYGPRRAVHLTENATFDPTLVVDVADAAGYGAESLAVLAAVPPSRSRSRAGRPFACVSGETGTFSTIASRADGDARPRH